MVAVGSLEPTAGFARLSLLGHLGLTVDGRSIRVPSSVGRLLSYLGLTRRPSCRSIVAQSLWPDVTQPRAAGNLRTSLWRLSQSAPELIDAEDDRLALSCRVHVDYAEALSVARALTDMSVDTNLDAIDEQLLMADLLTDQDGDWVDIERERFRQVRLHALETLAARLSCAAQHGRAIEIALAVVVAEPLRESAHDILIRAFLAEGNRGEAIAHYMRLTHLLREQLGLDPSTHLQQLLWSGCGSGVTSNGS